MFLDQKKQLESISMNQENLQDIFKLLLQEIEPSSWSREGLEDTPKRLAKVYIERFYGYSSEACPKITTFFNGADAIRYDQMIIDSGPFSSFCEHHLELFQGTYFFSYLPHPKGKILGLSKVGRVVDYFSARLQIQERLVQQILDYIWKELSKECKPPLGMAIMMRATHNCKKLRGVKKDGFMTTSAMKGVFRRDQGAKAEFLRISEMDRASLLSH